MIQNLTFSFRLMLASFCLLTTSEAEASQAYPFNQTVNEMLSLAANKTEDQDLVLTNLASAGLRCSEILRVILKNRWDLEYGLFIREDAPKLLGNFALAASYSHYKRLKGYSISKKEFGENVFGVTTGAIRYSVERWLEELKKQGNLESNDSFRKDFLACNRMNKNLQREPEP